MKMHSYITTNGQLHYVSMQSETVQNRLRHLAESVGGLEKALTDAKAHKAYLDELTEVTLSSDRTPDGTPDIFDGSSTTSVIDVPTASALRQRLVAASTAPAMDATSTDVVPPVSEAVQPPGMQTLVHHPDEEISALARELSEFESELTSTGPDRVHWPNNITYKNFAVYQLIPTLVYELEYPRTDRYVPMRFVVLDLNSLTSTWLQDTTHLRL